MVSWVPWCDGDAARTDTEEAARVGLMRLWSNKIGIERIDCCLSVCLVVFLVILLLVTSGPRRGCNGIFSLRGSIDDDFIATWLMHSFDSLFGNATLLNIVVVTILIDADLHF